MKKTSVKTDFERLWPTVQKEQRAFLYGAILADVDKIDSQSVKYSASENNKARRLILDVKPLITL